ncbi:MAG: hypothetical protein IKH86_11720 [Prevotella sp.]|nr:hypothetical protein [Prevotella sp.]
MSLRGWWQWLDKDFCQFSSMEYGFRAAFKVLSTYYHKHHLTTIEKMISRWAPPNENNTLRYIDFVAKYTGIESDSILYPPHNNEPTWMLLVEAMTVVECGTWNNELLKAEKQGYYLAFKKK